MENIFLQTIRKDRDAPYVNRGFYFQYLKVLKIWVDNFINGLDTTVFTEVDNDIKEVGEKIVYTQVKCYVSSFGLNSPAVKKELVGFFTQYLEQTDSTPELEFHFYTNTSVQKNDMLLSAWMENQPLEEGELQLQCTEKVREILLVQLGENFEKSTAGDQLSQFQKNAVTAGFEEIKDIIQSEKLVAFLSTIHWHFGDETPEESIISLHAAIMEDLKNEKFAGKPASILMEAMLSEIYRCSQLKSPEERKVDPERLATIIASKDAELNAYVNTALVDILEVRFYSVHQRITELEALQKQNEEKIHSNDVKIEEILSQKGQTGIMPKNLTRIPFINPSDVFGRQAELATLSQLLLQNSCVLINAGGGMGKSTLAKLYVQSSKEKYDHILWLDCENGLVDSLILNEILAGRVGLDPSTPPDKKFNAIISLLESTGSRGIIILDNLDGDTSQLENFRNLGEWDVLLTSRLRLKDWATYELLALPFAAAKALYKKFEPLRPADDDLLGDLFEFIEYNTLAIELIAKTIHLSYDLSLAAFLGYLRSQRLDDAELDVDLEENSTNTRLLLLINRTFDLGKLTKNDRFYMEFFAILPSEGTTLPDLVTWYGKEYEQGNKIEFARAINRLHSKGLIKRTENEIKMDRVFQESVLYQSRKELNPFVSQIMHITYLAARLNEGIKGDPAQALHFLKYAQSILKNIKEPFRRSLYQPLLLLENETLYITNWLEDTEVLLPLWKDLLKRASTYLGESDPMVGTMTNNFALALFGEGRTEEAVVYFDKAIELAKNNEVNPVNMLHMLSNRANIYIEQSDFENFKKITDEMLELREKHELGLDATFSLECHMQGVANMRLRNLTGAKKMFAIAIMSHKELPVDQRNDLNLIMFLCDMSACCLALEQPETAEKAAIEAVHHLGKLKIDRGTPFVRTLQVLLALAQHNGDEENVKKLRGILDSHL
jgi:hypothetical protein